MLATACPSGHGWLNTGIFAFLPPSSLNANDEPRRAALSTWCSVLYASSSADQHVSFLRPSTTGCRKRPRDATATVNASTMHRQSGRLSGLRGGGVADDAAHSASNNEDCNSNDTLPPTATPSSGPDSSKETQQQPRHGSQVSGAFQRQGTSPSASGAAFGVALVTERSTATGGSKGRVSYSVLADGTLQVARPGLQTRPTKHLVRVAYVLKNNVFFLGHTVTERSSTVVSIW